MIAAATALISPRLNPNLGRLAYHPVLCGRCGNRPGHPLARVCTDTNCALRANHNRSHGAGHSPKGGA